MQGKLFQRCTHLLYCRVLSLGGNVNTRRTLKPDMGSIFHYYVNYQNSMLLTSSDTNTDASILVYKFRPERIGFNMYAEYTQLQLTFLALHSWLWVRVKMGHKTSQSHFNYTSWFILQNRCCYKVNSFTPEPYLRDLGKCISCKST